MGCGQEHHASTVFDHLPPLRGVAGLLRPTQDAFHQQAAQAVGDEAHRPLANALQCQALQGSHRATGQGHGDTSLRIRLADEWHLPALAWKRRGGGITQRPHPDLPPEVLRQPVGPGRRLIVSTAPSGERVSTQPVHKHHIQSPLWREGMGNLVEISHGLGAGTSGLARGGFWSGGATTCRGVRGACAGLGTLRQQAFCPFGLSRPPCLHRNPSGCVDRRATLRRKGSQRFPQS